MAAAVELRGDFDAAALRRLARRSKDPGQIRRLLALAEIYEGRSRGEAARVGGVGLQTLRDWVLRFNATGPAGLIDAKAPGQPSKLNDEQRQQLLSMVETGPTPAIHGVVRWRRDCQEFRVGRGIVGKKETPYGPTERAADPGRYPGPVAGRCRCQDGL